MYWTFLVTLSSHDIAKCPNHPIRKQFQKQSDICYHGGKFGSVCPVLLRKTATLAKLTPISSTSETSAFWLHCCLLVLPYWCQNEGKTPGPAKLILTALFCRQFEFPWYNLQKMWKGREDQNSGEVSIWLCLLRGCTILRWKVWQVEKRRRVKRERVNT